MAQLNVDNIRNRTGSNGGPNFPSGITVAVGQTVKVKTKSNTVTQAGLTTASRYYVQNFDGSLGTTAAPGQSIDVGIALNSNTVLLQ